MSSRAKLKGKHKMKYFLTVLSLNLFFLNLVGAEAAPMVTVSYDNEYTYKLEGKDIFRFSKVIITGHIEGVLAEGESENQSTIKQLDSLTLKVDSVNRIIQLHTNPHVVRLVDKEWLIDTLVPATIVKKDGELKSIQIASQDYSFAYAESLIIREINIAKGLGATGPGQIFVSLTPGSLNCKGANKLLTCTQSFFTIIKSLSSMDTTGGNGEPLSSKRGPF